MVISVISICQNPLDFLDVISISFCLYTVFCLVCNLLFLALTNYSNNEINGNLSSFLNLLHFQKTLMYLTRVWCPRKEYLN